MFKLVIISPEVGRQVQTRTLEFASHHEAITAFNQVWDKCPRVIAHLYKGSKLIGHNIPCFIRAAS